MKRFIFAVVMTVCASAFAANPAFSDFTLTQFGTNGNKIVVKSGASLTNLSEVGQLGVNNSVNGASTPAMILKNLDPTAVTLHATGEFIQMADTGSNVRNAAYFKVQKEQEWTTTASTRDAKYVLGLALDGNLVDQISISSAGNLALLQNGAGIVFPDASVQTTAATGGGETNWTRFPTFIAPTAGSNFWHIGTNGVATNIVGLFGTNANFVIDPNAADGSAIASFDSSEIHTTGNLFTLANANSNIVQIAPDGNIVVGSNTLAWISSPDIGYALESFSGPDDPLEGRKGIYIGTQDAGGHEWSLKFTSTTNTSSLVISSDNDSSVFFNPTAGATSLPFYFNTVENHTANKLMLVQNAGMDKFYIDFSGAITLAGTTNQITFGATNTPPSSAVAPTKWISVQVAGEGAVYRVPLYE